MSETKEHYHDEIEKGMRPIITAININNFEKKLETRLVLEFQNRGRYFDNHMVKELAMDISDDLIDCTEPPENITKTKED